MEMEAPPDIFHAITQTQAQDDVQVIGQILDTGVSIDESFKYNLTPLQMATNQEKLNIAQYLVGRGANVDAVNSRGESALHFASSNVSLDIARFLINHGANINHQMITGETPLHAACLKAVPDFVRLFLDSGADMHIVNEDGFTPFIHACEILSEFFPEDERENRRARQLDIVRTFLERGEDPNYQHDPFRRTAIGEATRSNNAHVVRLLLDHGANPFLQASNGESAWTISQESPEIRQMIQDWEEWQRQMAIERAKRIHSDSYTADLLYGDPEVRAMGLARQLRQDRARAHLPRVEVSGDSREAQVLRHAIRNLCPELSEELQRLMKRVSDIERTVAGLAPP